MKDGVLELDAFPERDYLAMLTTRHQAAMLGFPGMEPWPADKAARLMAILECFGNNEGFSLSPKFKIDCKYIQELYRVDGGETPDADFIRHYQHWQSVYEKITSAEDPTFEEAAAWIKQMYNFKLYV